MAQSEQSPAKAAPLGFFSLTTLGINGMVGVGIFFVPATIHGLLPVNGAFIYPLAAFAMVPIATCYSILGNRFREDGGPYIWARAAFGVRSAFAVGWVSYISALFSTSAVIRGLGQYLGPYLGFTGELGALSFSLLATLCLTACAAAGLRISSWLWSGLTLLKLIPLFALLIFSWIKFGPFLDSNLALIEALPQASSSSPTIMSWLRAALVALFAIQGFEILAVPSGNIRARSNALTWATGLSLAFVALLYFLLHRTAQLSVSQLSSAASPLAASAHALRGQRLGGLVEIGIQISAIGIAFGMFAMTPRYLAALGGSSGFGAWLSRHTPRLVPLPALLVTAAAVALIVSLGPLEELFVLASMAVLSQFAASVLALTRLAWKRQNGLSRWHLLWQPTALLSLVLVGAGAKPGELLILLAVLSLGWALRYLSQRLNPLRKTPASGAHE